MKEKIKALSDSLDGFVTRHEQFIFTTLARILAVGCVAVAAYFAWKLSRQMVM